MADNTITCFGRGQTHYSGRTIDTNNLDGVELEGFQREFNDVDVTASPIKTRRSSRPITGRIFRNMLTVAILPSRTFTVAASAPTRVTGYTTTAAQVRTFVADEYLPAAGAPAGDLFWGMVKGPVKVYYEVVPTAAVAVGDYVVAAVGAANSTGATAATTTGDAGRITKQVFAAPTDAGTTATYSNQVQNKIGTAMSARTTAETNTLILVDLDINW